MSKTCTICATPGPLDLYPSSSIIPGTCKYHCSKICTQCISRSLSADIANKPTYRIGCPSCQKAWDRTVVESYVSEKELEKYDFKVLMQALTSIPGFRVCQSSSCTSGQIHEDGNKEPMVTCIECGFRSCYTHLIPWHTGLTCAEYDHRAHKGLKGWWKVKRLERAERKFRTTFGEAAKPCPRCKSLISKDGGCYHMTCKSPVPARSTLAKEVHEAIASKTERQAQTAASTSAGNVLLITTVSCTMATNRLVLSIGLSPWCSIGTRTMMTYLIPRMMIYLI